MWKKQWNKLKTALGSPEEYIEEESAEEEAVEEQEVEELRTDPIINVQYEDFLPVVQLMKSLEEAKKGAGEMLLRHERDRRRAVEVHDQINARIQEEIDGLRTSYNVDPSTDYQLNFPQVEGEAGSFVRLKPEGAEE